MKNRNFNIKELKKSLTKNQYEIIYNKGTEPAFHNEYWNNKQEGIYVDIVTGVPLFSSKDKYESGTGWPSFTRPIQSKEIKEKKDYSFGMSRDEVVSRSSEGHLGHVFNDGPAPYYRRYCMNSAALKFITVDDLEREGYRDHIYLFPDYFIKSGYSIEIATFAAGCFWGVEAFFKQIKGVIDVTVGYTGGITKNPTYSEVCSGKTGHAEAILIKYDPFVVSYKTLLKNFWKAHDPTQLNRQGNDIGIQYRSVIFAHNDKQKEEAKKSLEEEKKKRKKTIMTKILNSETFYIAEDYHQNYLEKNPGGYCHVDLSLAQDE